MTLQRSNGDIGLSENADQTIVLDHRHPAHLMASHQHQRLIEALGFLLALVIASSLAAPTRASDEQ